MRRTPQHSRGFTLIEVLVALSVFAVVAVVMQETTASLVPQYESVRKKMYAGWIAENKFAELRLAEAMPNAREYKENIEYAEQEWEIVSKISTTNDADIRRAEISVFLISGISDEERVSTYTGFLGRY